MLTHGLSFSGELKFEYFLTRGYSSATKGIWLKYFGMWNICTGHWCRGSNCIFVDSNSVLGIFIELFLILLNIIYPSKADRCAMTHWCAMKKLQLCHENFRKSLIYIFVMFKRQFFKYCRKKIKKIKNSSISKVIFPKFFCNLAKEIFKPGGKKRFWEKYLSVRLLPNLI